MIKRVIPMNRAEAWYVLSLGIIPGLILSGVGTAIGIGLAVGCSNLKGQDTARHTDFGTTSAMATTQQAAVASVERHATTRTSGGAAATADYTARVDVSPAGITVEAVDHRSASTQPTVVTYHADREQQATRTDRRTDARTAAAVTDDTKTGPSFSGSPNGKFSVDGLMVQSVESTWAKRWPIFTGLVAAGLFFTFMPIRFGGNVVSGIGFFAGAAASLILSDFWAIAVCAAAVLLAFWPHIKNSALLGRVVAQLDDWKSDMLPHEREAFDASMQAAAGSSAPLVDKLRVEMKHGPGPAVVAPPVPSNAA